jgi:hypothetical protein
MVPGWLGTIGNFPAEEAAVSCTAFFMTDVIDRKREANPGAAYVEVGPQIERHPRLSSAPARP